nr:hypothetical protein BgiMline_017900 [Biomphalaria glabrata]
MVLHRLSSSPLGTSRRLLSSQSQAQLSFILKSVVRAKLRGWNPVLVGLMASLQDDRTLLLGRLRLKRLEDETLPKDETHCIEDETLPKDETHCIEDETLPKDETHCIEDETLPEDETHCIEDETLPKDETHCIEDETLPEDETHCIEDETLPKD